MPGTRTRRIRSGPRHRTRRIGLAAALLLLACRAAPAFPDAEAVVTIGGVSIGVELADTREEQVQGLSGRSGLAHDRGLLFVYDQPGFYSFWMKDMHFDIDIVWLRGGRIVDITPSVPHRVDPPLPTYRPRELADGVLEVAAGSALAHGWRIGDPVAIERR